VIGLAGARRTRVDARSKGTQQRLGIAQALVEAPKVLLLDEAMNGLEQRLAQGGRVQGR
jgi:ABC-type multidrug transport system ATPase subunit